MRIITLTTLSLALLITACQKDSARVEVKLPVLPAEMFNYAQPDDDVMQFIDQSRFQVDDAKATLGRVLFYDNILSLNNKVSCGSCHLQAEGFGDPVSLSMGINNTELDRHTMALSNQYNDAFLFWDGRSENLKDLVLKPVRNHKEMGLDNMEFLIAKVEKASYYDDLFTNAYGSDEVSQEKLADALAQFLTSMVSYSSKIDKVNRGEATFTQAEMDGHNIFFGEGRCYQCHGGTDFNQRGGFFEPPFPSPFGWGTPAANIGLDVEYEDPGFGAFSEEMNGVFKIPSLRNIERTGPYMHDGRFATLDEVIEHYNSGVQDHPNLDESVKDWSTSGPMRLHLSEYQKSSLKAFLLTLTDEDFLNDPKFSDPFVK